MASNEPTDQRAPRFDAREARADRNLLLGLLAFQGGFITHDTLVDAVHAWVLDKEKPVGSILLDWGAIDPGQLQALGVLVKRQLANQRNHGGERSPIADATASQSGLVGSPTDDEKTAVFSASASHPRPEAAAGGNRVDAPSCRYRKPDRLSHARGGLGEVFIADDLELGRKVALKEIRDQNAFDEQSRARFLLEGEVTGNLEHPGIVPVYGLGVYDDGRPYYAMRFIRGKNLRDTVQELRADRPPGEAPGAKALELRKLLRRFIDVCNAVEYAHSRDVLHRDLKPANIMLGKFGETLVVDWGLAKLMGRHAENGSTVRGDPGEGPFHLSASSSGVEPTRHGALGTLQYMSPEQALGKLDKLGPRTDVFGLGATLYYLLTGQAPFPDSQPEKIVAGIFRKPRDLDPTVPRPLEAICLKAMATKADDRYPSPLALAEEVDRWLEDRPVDAYPDPLPVRVRRWSRRNRTWVATAASLLVASAVGLAINNVIVDRERSKAEKARQDAVDTLIVTGEALQRLMVGVVVDRLNEVPGTLAIRKDLSEEAIGIARKYLQRWPKDPVVALVAAPVFHLAANLDRSLGRFDRAMVDYRDATMLYDLAIGSGQSGRTTLRVDSIRLAIDHAEALRMGNRRDEALAQFDEAYRRITELRAEAPDDPASAMLLARYDYDKGHVLLAIGRLDEARAMFEESISLLEKNLARGTPAAMSRLILTSPLLGRGMVALEQARLDDAGLAFDRALENLAKLEPTSNVQALRALTLDERARWLARTSRRNEAGSALDEAVEIFSKLTRDFPYFPQYRLSLAATLLDRGLNRLGLGADRRDEARRDAEQGRAILESLQAEAPTSDELRGLLGEAFGLLGRLEADPAARRRLLDRAEAEQRQVLRQNPKSPRDLEALRRHLEALEAAGGA